MALDDVYNHTYSKSSGYHTSTADGHSFIHSFMHTDSFDLKIFSKQIQIPTENLIRQVNELFSQVPQFPKVSTKSAYQ